jgi:hypothetical protein
MKEAEGGGAWVFSSSPAHTPHIHPQQRCAIKDGSVPPPREATRTTKDKHTHLLNSSNNNNDDDDGDG